MLAQNSFDVMLFRPGSWTGSKDDHATTSLSEGSYLGDLADAESPVEIKEVRGRERYRGVNPADRTFTKHGITQSG